jgi:AcrR family transcriptional regulator
MSGFTESERSRIREGLVTAGRDQFASFGLDRTRISDLTDEVGIATSTFYRFFDSKEALYLEVLEHEQQSVAEGFESAIADATDLREEVAIGFAYFLSELESNQLYYKLIVMDDIQPLLLSASESKLNRFYRNQMEMFKPHIQRWIESDDFRVNDPAALLGIFRLLAYTIVAKDRFDNTDVDVSELDTAHEMLIETVVDGLIVG